MKKISILIITITFVLNTFAQIGGPTQLAGGDINTITTAVPFLLIAPESRGGAMGDIGVATTPDVNSMHYNPAKYAFIKKDVGVSVSYSPWLRALVDDINLAYLSGYKKFDENQVVSASLRYFSLGSITFTNEQGNNMGDFNPNEFAVDAAYSRLFSDRIAGSIAMRYINSNLTLRQYVGGIESKPGQAVAADVSVYYQNDDLKIQKKDAILAFGLNISNIGNKMSYTENEDKDPIPTNLRLGSSLTLDLDDYNKIMVTGELAKLLVPSPPVYYAVGEVKPNGDTVTVSGKDVHYGYDPNVSVPVGMYQSFYDAPGVQLNAENPDDRSVFKEEMHEINYALGMEYWYSDQFALRAGYFHEHATKGNRKFFTLGLGLRLNVFALDFSYLIPVNQRNPLEHTLRFTLSFNFEGLKQEASDKTNAVE